jgi:hypothetical protein
MLFVRLHTGNLGFYVIELRKGTDMSFEIAKRNFIYRLYAGKLSNNGFRLL